jgi:hypothetical protein
VVDASRPVLEVAAFQADRLGRPGDDTGICELRLDSRKGGICENRASFTFAAGFSRHLEYGLFRALRLFCIAHIQKIVRKAWANRGPTGLASAIQ